MRKLSKVFLGVSLFLVASTQLSLAEDQVFSAGILGGLGFYNNNFGTQPTVGATFNYKFAPKMSVGFTGFIGIMGGTRGAGTITSMGYYDAHYNYYFSECLAELLKSETLRAESLKGLWVGARAGLGYFHSSLNIASKVSKANFNFGPALGYDYMITNDISAGLDLSYLWATSVSSISVNSFNTLVAVKYHF